MFSCLLYHFGFLPFSYKFSTMSSLISIHFSQLPLSCFRYIAAFAYFLLPFLTSLAFLTLFFWIILDCHPEFMTTIFYPVLFDTWLFPCVFSFMHMAFLFHQVYLVVLMALLGVYIRHNQVVPDLILLITKQTNPNQLINQPNKTKTTAVSLFLKCNFWVTLHITVNAEKL